MSPRSQIVSMAQNGRPPREIAAQLGIDATRIYNTLAEERRKGIPIPRFRGGPSGIYHKRVHVDGAVLDAFEPAARARHMTCHELAAELLAVLANDPDLIEAVLDDGGAA